MCRDPFVAVCISAAIIYCSTSVSSAKELLATPDSIGSIKIGMDKADVEHAAGYKIQEAQPPFNKTCYVTQASRPHDQSLQYTFENDKLTRIDVRPLGRQSLSVETKQGASFRTDRNSLEKIYGNTLSISLAPYYDEATSDAEYYLTLDNVAKNDNSIIFVLKGNTVERIIVGNKATIKNPEPCQ